MKAIEIEWDIDNIDDEETPMNLPIEVEIPSDIHEDDIADYLSDTYYYCVKGYSIT